MLHCEKPFAASSSLVRCIFHFTSENRFRGESFWLDERLDFGVCVRVVSVWGGLYVPVWGLANAFSFPSLSHLSHSLLFLTLSFTGRFLTEGAVSIVEEHNRGEGP